MSGLHVVLAGIIGAGGQPPADPVRELALPYNGSHYRSHGALLTIKAWAERDPRRGIAIRIDYAIHYAGPRHPLIIHRPSLDFPSGQETQLCVYHANEAGRAVITRLESPNRPAVLGGFNFLTAEDCGPTTGQLVAYLEGVVLRSEKGRATPMHLSNVEHGKSVYLRLRHNPSFRGGDYDAWTGDLFSNVVPLTIPK